MISDGNTSLKITKDNIVLCAQFNLLQCLKLIILFCFFTKKLSTNSFFPACARCHSNIASLYFKVFEQMVLIDQSRQSKLKKQFSIQATSEQAKNKIT